MPADEQLRALIARIGAFHITDRRLKRAQREIEAAIADGRLDDRMRGAYLDAARGYFEGFRQEAHAHLRDVDRRLEQINQVHFNLTAERGVAVKRIAATQTVLEELAALDSVAR